MMNPYQRLVLGDIALCLGTLYIAIDRGTNIHDGTGGAIDWLLLVLCNVAMLSTLSALPWDIVQSRRERASDGS